MPYYRNDEWNEVLREIRNRHINQLQEEEDAARKQWEAENGVVDEAMSDVAPEYRPGGAKYTPPVEVPVAKNLIQITGDTSNLFQQAPPNLRASDGPWPVYIDAKGQTLTRINTSKSLQDTTTGRVYTDTAMYVGNNKMVIYWR